MPFTIELSTYQKTPKWTFKQTNEALELQALLKQGDRKAYGKRLIELSKTHNFTKVDGVVYELFDEGETILVPIRFQVKGSVITWAFVAPKDATHQSFRDLVFNTAAKAHACVTNSCETYYRGTDHFHIKVMHSYAEEAIFNHNHYRTADDGPITPVEVYQHLMAFYAQKEGRQFLCSLDERDSIILKYALYWAQYNADIRYAPLFLLKGEAGEPAFKRLFTDIAKIGRLTPNQADVVLDEFFASENGINIYQLAMKQGLPYNNLNELKNYLKTSYRKVYFKVAADMHKDIALDGSLEPHPIRAEHFAAGSGNRSSHSSPREDYESAFDQALDDIDKLEKESLASDLTKHCQSIDKQLLQDLELDDFRKGLILYHALRTAQQNSKLLPGEGTRFHTDLTTATSIREMVKELPFLQHGSTEDEIGGPLLNKLVTWVKTASPELDQWVDWVKVNGSRGLGAEIGLVRQVDGSVDLKQAVPQMDRNANDKLPEINFDAVDLSKIFLPKKQYTHAAVVNPFDVAILKEELGKELKQLVTQQAAGIKLERVIFQAKVSVIEAALGVLSGKSTMTDLQNALETHKNWKFVSIIGAISKLEMMIQHVKEIFEPTQEAVPGSAPSLGSAAY